MAPALTATLNNLSFPLRIGLVGTGYTAKLRAETLQHEPRATLIAVAGHTPTKTETFAQTYQAEPLSSWQALVERADLDLVMIATVNRDHGAIARAALQAGKHVVVEYPLSLDVAEAEALLTLAKAQNLLLHVEHIELLGGLHQALLRSLPLVGKPFHVRYATMNPRRPAPQRWTYNPVLFGFPLVGALSRIHRLTNAFGSVATVSCQTRFWGTEAIELTAPADGTYTTCLCTAHLRFTNDLRAEVVYGKGECLWQAERKLEVHGEKGALIFGTDQATLIQPDGTYPIEVGGRRGLFAKDTHMVLEHLAEGQPLYVTPEESLYALRVADAACRAAEAGQVVQL